MKSKSGIAHQIPRKGGQIVAPPYYPLIMYQPASPFVNIIWIEKHVIYVNAVMKSTKLPSHYSLYKIPKKNCKFTKFQPDDRSWSSQIFCLRPQSGC